LPRLPRWFHKYIQDKPCVTSGAEERIFIGFSGTAGSRALSKPFMKPALGLFQNWRTRLLALEARKTLRKNVCSCALRFLHPGAARKPAAARKGYFPSIYGTTKVVP